MSITVDEAGVRLDAAGWRALLDGSANEQTLQAAHAVAGTPQAIAAGRQPVAIMQLQVTTPRGVFSHHAWIAHQAIALLIDRGEGEHRLMALAPDHFAISLARLCGVGPRGGGMRSSRPVSEGSLDLWFSDDAPARTEALESLGADRAWQLLIQPAEGPEDATILMAAADGPTGVWLVEPRETGLVLEPVTPTWTFRALAGVLDQLP